MRLKIYWKKRKMGDEKFSQGKKYFRVCGFTTESVHLSVFWINKKNWIWKTVRPVQSWFIVKTKHMCGFRFVFFMKVILKFIHEIEKDSKCQIIYLSLQKYISGTGIFWNLEIQSENSPF